MLGGVTTGLGVMLALFINQDAVGQPKQGGTLTVPIITQTFVEDFNPYSGAQGDLVTGTMFEPLWVLNTLKGEIDWRLAEGFELSLIHI